MTQAGIHVLSCTQISPDAPRIDSRTVAPGDIALAVLIGRASEYFDFFVYGLASVLVFPALFFPHADRLHGLLYSFAVFPLAFLVRPFGTLMGMAIQKRLGRATKLTVALYVLGCSTVGIALLPDARDGSMGLAVGLLALCRTGQGLALGCSWDGLPSLLALNAPASRRGWYSMLSQLGAPCGFFLASSLFGYFWASLSADEFLSWGWRFPFFMAFAVNVVALFARLRLVVTREYESQLQAHELDPCAVRELFSRQGSNFFFGAFAALASYALFHLVTVFPLSWVALHAPHAVGHFLMLELVGAVLCCAAMPLSGVLADHIGGRATLGLSAALIALFSLALPALLGGGALGQGAFILIGFWLLGLSYAQTASWVTSNFLPRFRYTGAALTADLAWLVGAAFAPLVALGLSSRFGLLAAAAYLLSGAVSTLACCWLFKRSGRPLPGTAQSLAGMPV